ncbi:hypothetical protein ONZ45_g12753 [Pleurotus djamor]|nr:hypothetical protein ONZ45_g12753 [Pleurotus djamor]
MPAYTSRGQARFERLQRLSPIATRAKVKVHEWLAQTSQLSSTFPSLATAESIDGLFPPLPKVVGHTPAGSPALSYTSSPLSSLPASPDAGSEFAPPLPEPVGHTPAGSPALSYTSSPLSSPPASPGAVGGFVPPLPQFEGSSVSNGDTEITAVESDDFDEDVEMDAPAVEGDTADFTNEEVTSKPATLPSPTHNVHQLQAAIAEHPQFIEAQILVFRLRKAEDAYLASVKEFITALQVGLGGN